MLHLMMVLQLVGWFNIVTSTEEDHLVRGSVRVG